MESQCWWWEAAVPCSVPRAVAQKWSLESLVLGEHNADSHRRCDKVCQVCSCPNRYYSVSDSAGGQ